MHPTSSHLNGPHDTRDAIDAEISKLNEFWIRAEDWAENLADAVAARYKLGWLWLQERPIALRWISVFVGVTASMLVGLAMHDNVTASSQLLLFLPAVLLSAMYSGVYAGTISSLFGAIATILWKMTPANATFAPNIVGLFLYFVACGIVLGLSRAQENQREQIMQFTENLEGKIRERTADLESANNELSGFCYSISHDLRAPIRNIVGSSRILIEEAGDQLDSESKRRLYGLANSANKLASWVDDLLNHARLGHTEVKPEWINLTKMVDELCLQLQNESWPFSSVTIHVQPNLVTTGDRVLARLALHNLLENAFKYSKSGEPLLIEVGEKYIGRRSYLYVQDNGIGFEQQYAKKIFEPFQRLHRDDEYTGTGIGLANVRSIVECHGGEIMAEGDLGKGSRFLFRFGSGKKSIRKPDASPI